MTELTEQIPTNQNIIPKSKGRLQNRITLLLIAILVPILVIFAWYDITSQRQNLEALILERAESTATSGAATVSSLLEHAIENGELTREEVFDTNYQQYWEFDENAYPDFDGDPASLAKYHTAYDEYTDESWQELVDSFLGGEDVIFAIPVDKNGYLPTHNTRWSSWDGSPATDRSKRIFDDPVGINAARNTEPIIQQVYDRPGTSEILWDVSAPIYVDGEHWGAFRVGIELAQNQERVIAATWQTIFGLGLVIALVAIFSLVVGRYVSAPIVKLTAAATQAAAGDLSQQVDIRNRQEITTLAQAFNSMTLQIRDLISNLETRVAARTQDLNLAAEIGNRITQVRQVDKVLNEATPLIKDQFGLYQVQIYLTDPSRETLILRASDGHAGSRLLETHHQLPIDENSLNGSAAYNKQAVIVADTRDSAMFRPHPLLPDTRSEMVVPIILEDDVLGVIDLQSDEANALTEDILPAFSVLAGQLAIAIMNARQNRAVQDNQRLMRTIIDTSPDWIVVKNRDNQFVLVNQAFSDYVGLPTEEMVGKNDIEVGFDEEIVRGNPEKDIPGFWPEDQQVMESGEPFQKDDVLEDFGKIRYNSTIKIPLKDENGEVIGLVVFVHDVTAEKSSEIMMASRAEELQSVAEVATAVAATSDPQQLVQQVVDLTKERFDLYHTQIYLLDESGKKLFLAAGAGDIGKMMAAEGRIVPINREQSLVATAVRTRESVIANNVMLHPAYLPNPLLPDTRSVMAVPLIAGDEVLGVLDVRGDVIDRFNNEDAQIHMTLAAQTAVALQNARQFEQTQQALANANTFRQLVNAANQGIGITSIQENETVYINPALANILQIENPEEELIGKSLGEFYPEDFQKRFQEEIIPTILEQGSWEGEMWLGDPDEPTYTYENHFLLRDESGNPTFAAAVISDITERKQTEEVIRENQSLMRTIIDSSPDWIIVKDRENRYLLSNQAFAEYVGMPAEEMVGKNDLEVGFEEELVKGNPEKGFVGFWPEDQGVMNGGEEVVFPPGPVEMKGKTHHFATRKIPIKNTDGDVTGLVIFTQDVTQQELAREEQAQLAQALEEQLAQVNALQRAMTREGWEAFLVNTQREATGFAFSGDDVRTFDDSSFKETLGDMPIDLREIRDISYNEAETAVSMPLEIHGEQIGVIGARNASGEPLNDEQKALLATLTAQVAEALDRVRLFEETEINRQEIELQAAELATVNEISDLVSSQLNFDNLINSVGERLMNTFAANTLFIALADDKTQTINFPYYTNREEGNIENIPPISVDNESSFTGQIYKTRQPLLYTAMGKPLDEKAVSIGGKPKKNGRKSDSFLGVPMIVGDRVIGVVGLNGSKELRNYDEDDIPLLSTLASTIAISIQNTLQYEDTQRRANREALVNEISQKIQNAATIESAMQTAVAELGKALNLKHAVAKLNKPNSNGN
jgi:PAS domain S-box-containing protein